MQSQLNCLGLKIKMGMIQEATFIYSDPEQKDRVLENEEKIKRYRDGTYTKKDGKLHFGFKFYSIIDRDYELIRRFKTTKASLMILT